MTKPAEDRREFIDRLEALRGVAAMMVAVGHCAVTFPAVGIQLLLVKGLITLCNGRAAVTIFFVLSGFVLGLSLRRTRATFLPGFVQFVLRRIFRIYPALVLSSLAIFVYLHNAYYDAASSPTTAWFQSIHPQRPDWDDLWRNLLLLDFSLNDVTWSLRVELIGSVLLPFFHVWSQRVRWRGKAALMAGLLGLAWCLQHQRGGLFFMFMFYLGYLLPEVGPPLFAWLARRRMAAPLVATAVALCLGARWLHVGPFAGFFVEGLAAGVLIAGIVHGPDLSLYRTLDSVAARFYGRISYSFYLLHFCVMYGITVAMLRQIPHPLLDGHGLWWGLVLAVVSVIVATPISWVSYRWVERPSMELGRRVVSRWRKPRDQTRSRFSAASNS